MRVTKSALPICHLKSPLLLPVLLPQLRALCTTVRCKCAAELPASASEPQQSPSVVNVTRRREASISSMAKRRREAAASLGTLHKQSNQSAVGAPNQAKDSRVCYQSQQRRLSGCKFTFEGGAAAKVAKCPNMLGSSNDGGSNSRMYCR